jgi:hypothetical protein
LDGGAIAPDFFEMMTGWLVDSALLDSGMISQDLEQGFKAFRLRSSLHADTTRLEFQAWLYRHQD